MSVITAFIIGVFTGSAYWLICEIKDDPYGKGFAVGYEFGKQERVDRAERKEE